MKSRLSILLISLVMVPIFSSSAFADWGVDFSRRAKDMRDADLSEAAQVGRYPASAGGTVIVGEPAQEKTQSKGLLDTLFDTGEPVQEIVILNTDRGFVPASVHVRKNGRYKVHVVNVNDKDKNISFILDGFSEHHATYYGKVKTFMLEPKQEGIFSFQSPETAAEGRLVVFNPQVSVREPAGEKLR